MSSLNDVSYEVFFGFAPRKGPRAMPLTLDFSAASSVEVDLMLAQTEDRLEWVQSVYVDNSANTASVSITSAITGQTLTWGAGYQGYLPFMCPNHPKFTATSSGGVAVDIHLLTFPVPAFLWNDGTQSGTVLVRDAGSDGTDYSSAAASVAANLLLTIPANANRNEVWVQNQSASQIQVVVDNGVSGGTVILLEGGGANTQGADWSSTTHKGRVRVFAGSAGLQVGAREW